MVATALVALMLLPFSLEPAGAHEITVAVAISTALDEAVSKDLGDGLRLAIDQSPDIGHAPGSAAGDHLGGVDVKLTEITEIDDLARQDISGALILIVAGDAATVTAAAVDLRPGSGFITALVIGQGEINLDLPIAILRPTESSNAVTYVPFAEAFEARFTRAPSHAAANGFDVGQLLDSLIRETDGAVPDLAALDSVIVEVNGRLTTTTLETRQSASANTGAVHSTNRTCVLILAGAITTISALAYRTVSRRRAT